ncbi:BON domain-containing protein [Alphaproteobacteria bacterium]|nr:BON domain-containing protein [Alphaproteobacteria bacterium]
MKKVYFKKIIFIILFLILCGCTASSVTSMAGNAIFSEKGFKASVNDAYIFSQVKAKITSIKLTNLSNVGVHVSSGKVLLVGILDSSFERLEIIKSAWSVPDVIEVFNEIRIGQEYTMLERSNDLFLEAKIRSKLLLDSLVLTNNYSLQVLKKDLFIIGISRSIEEKNRLHKVLREVDEINKIVNFVVLKNQSLISK